MEKSQLIYFKSKRNKVLKFIVRYNILQDGKHVECGLKTWQEALKKAAKYENNIFKEHKVEILNLWTGEILNINEARERAKSFNERVNSATT